MVCLQYFNLEVAHCKGSVFPDFLKGCGTLIIITDIRQGFQRCPAYAWDMSFFTYPPVSDANAKIRKVLMPDGGAQGLLKLNKQCLVRFCERSSRQCSRPMPGMTMQRHVHGEAMERLGVTLKWMHTECKRVIRVTFINPPPKTSTVSGEDDMVNGTSCSFRKSLYDYLSF